MDIEFSKLKNKKLLVVESDDNLFKNVLTDFVISYSGAQVKYCSSVPDELNRLFVVEGIEACLIHSPSLKYDVRTILDMKKYAIPLIVLTSAVFGDDDAGSKLQLEKSGISTLVKIGGMDCYRLALRSLNEQMNDD